MQGRADLLRDGRDPLEQALERARAGTRRRARSRSASPEAVADRTPEVLLDQAVRLIRGRLTLIVRPRDPAASA